MHDLAHVSWVGSGTIDYQVYVSWVGSGTIYADPYPAEHLTTAAIGSTDLDELDRDLSGL